MKKLKTIFSPKKIAIWLIVIMAVITIPELNKPSLSQTDAIVTMMCVDSDGNKVEIVCSVLAPTGEKSPSYQTYSSNGASVGEAVEKMSLNIGKEMAFAQCEILAFGENISQMGIVGAMDFMTRTKKISRNAILMNFTGELEEFAKAIGSLQTKQQLKIENIINYDRRYILATSSDIDTFYSGYYSDISLGIIPTLKLNSQQTNNSIPVQAQNQQETGEQPAQQEEQKMFLTNDGTTSVFKHGKKILEIDADYAKKINFLIDNGFEGVVVVENITDNKLKDATITFNVSKSDIGVKTKFEDGLPKIKYSTKLTVFIEEIYDNDPTEKYLIRNKEFMTPKVIELLKQQVKKEMTEAIDFCVSNNIDILDVYKNFYKFNNKQFKKFVDRVGLENYLANIQFDVDVEIASTF